MSEQGQTDRENELFPVVDANGLTVGHETFAQRRDRLLVGWQNLDRQLDQIKEAEKLSRVECYSFLFGSSAKVGTNSYDLGNGWKVKAVRKINYKLEQDAFKLDDAKKRIAAIGNRGPELAEQLIKVKYELSETNYKKLVEDAGNYDDAKQILAIINELITTSDGTPGFEIVPPKDKR